MFWNKPNHFSSYTLYQTGKCPNGCEEHRVEREIDSIDRFVKRAVEHGDFPSESACASAMVNWLMLNDYANPSQIYQSATDKVCAKDRSPGTSEAEQARLQYDILRERDA